MKVNVKLSNFQFEMFCYLLSFSFGLELRACVGKTDEHKRMQCPLENSVYFDISQIDEEIVKGYDSFSIYELYNLSDPNGKF